MKRLFLLTIITLAGYLAQAQDLDSLLKVISNSDQQVRNDFLRVYRQQPQQTDSILLAVNKMRETDRENRRIVFDLLDRSGWPDGISGESHKAIWLVIQHADQSDIKRYIPLVEEQVRKKNLAGSDYATMLDRVLMGDKLPQRYGTQTTTAENRKTGAKTNYVWPVENPEKLDSLRATVELIPMADYLIAVEQATNLPAEWDVEKQVGDFISE
ncbi:DUF6624 domain-containing protein [uncultured Alistipes sp.]|jgi:hypothetical protein|uniref:DUF6624 domain-containing protein n=1 Tax=uncultured Alistipes sp. TaxID=538949 RepID=UPI0025FCCA71|nr:DUF6624 domain-containing protein [uncultured Alistipes sp.]